MRPLLRYVLILYNIIGLNPLQRNTFGMVRCFSACVSSFMLVVGCILHVVFYWDGVKTFSDIFMFPSIVILLVKLATVLVNRKILSRILKNIDKTSKFWSAEKFGNEVLCKMNASYKKTFLVGSLYFMLTSTAVTLLVVGPIFMTRKVLISPGYFFCDLKTSPCFEVVHIWQSFMATLQAMPASTGFDLLFMCLVGEGYCAIQMLKYALKDIEDNEVKQDDKIAEFAHQHSIVLNYIRELSKFYSGTMLVQCWSSLVALVFCLYMITSEGIPPPLGLVARYGGLFLVLTVQLFCYCVGGTIILEETLKVSDVVYGLNWWKKTQPKFRKKLTFIIQRSQKAEKLTVGKMMDLNLESFIQVMRNVVSVYALLITVEQKTQSQK